MTILSLAPVFPAAEVKELEEKGELEDGDPLNGFFKKIFAQVMRKHPQRPNQGACTLQSCRVICCGEYSSVVKVSTCNTPLPVPCTVRLLLFAG
jgi:hypothetical protein